MERLLKFALDAPRLDLRPWKLWERRRSPIVLQVFMIRCFKSNHFAGAMRASSDRA